MPSRKRTASEALLPTRAPKQARMTLDQSATLLGVRSGHSHTERLLPRWIALFGETVRYLFKGPDETPLSVTSEDSSSPPRRPPNPSPTNHSTLPARAPIPEFNFSPPPRLPSLPPPWQSQPTAPQRRQNALATSSAVASMSSTPAPSSSLAGSGHDLVQAALDKSRAHNRLADGVHRKYRRKEHIHAKLHKARVNEELKMKLYELQRAKGFSSDFDTFRGYLEYRQRLQELQKRESTSPSPSFQDFHSRSKTPSDQILLPIDDHFFDVAIQKARKTFESPKPPKPFLPTIEQLRLSTRARDETIDQRLHPKRPPLPERLPDDVQAEVNQLLHKKGIISKTAKEQVTDKDLCRLRPQQWLNDELINFYGQLILNRSLEADAAKENGKTILNVHYFNTFFWTKLNEGYEKSRLAKWTKKLDIFSKDVLLIPVNHANAHWTAAAINFRLKRIESYDSMGMSRPDVYEALRMYLDEEHKNKKKKPFDFSGWEDRRLENIPQQENHYDCGVFTCQYLETLSRGEEEFNFSQRNMPYLRQRMIWEIGRARLDEDVP